MKRLELEPTPNMRPNRHRGSCACHVKTAWRRLCKVSAPSALSVSPPHPSLARRPLPRPQKMPKICENTGSAARDFAMLERNLLSHIRLATLLLLLSASVLLNARLPSPSEPSGKTPHTSWSIPLASVQTGTAVVTILAGVWEYHRGYKDMQDMRGFLLATKYVCCQLYLQSAAHMLERPHFWVMSAIAVVVFASCIMFIGNNKSL